MRREAAVSAKKPYICYACKDGKHFLCHTNLDPKKPCMCSVNHVKISEGKISKYSNGVWQ